MSNERRAELKKEGYTVIQNIWLIVMLVSFFASLGIGIGVGQSQISSHEKRLAMLEADYNSHKEEQNKSVTYRNQKLDEITINLQSIMERLHLKYVKLEERK